MGSGLNSAARSLKAICLLAFILAWLGQTTFAQQSARGTISGQVTADQGQVIGFRVAAHKIWIAGFGTPSSRKKAITRFRRLFLASMK